MTHKSGNSDYRTAKFVPTATLVPFLAMSSVLFASKGKERNSIVSCIHIALIAFMTPQVKQEGSNPNPRIDRAT